MTRIPDPSIRPVRICPEHACRIFDAEHFLVRPEIRLSVTSKAKIPTRQDRSGRLQVATEEHFGHDDSYPPNHDRHIVFRAHCYRLDDGNIGATGKLDPKEMIVGNINYRQLAFVNPRCEICEDMGQMIPIEERFESSKYRPGTVG